ETELVVSILEGTEMSRSIKWGAPVYTINGKNVVGYGRFKHHFSIWFYNGVFLKDPYKVLITASGGKTKALRQWRISDVSGLNTKRFREYIREAIQNEKEGKSWKPEKSTPLATPQLLKTAFAKHKGLQQAFE